MSNSLLRTGNEITDVYNKYVDTVYRICLMMLKNVSETEDATQTVFIRYMQCQKQFKSEEHIKAWLIITAQNVCKDIFKNWWKLKRVDIEDCEEKAYINENSFDGVMQQVLTLPSKYKIPIYLYYYEGYSTEEISKMFKINHQAIRTRLRSARKKLKFMLEEELK